MITHYVWVTAYGHNAIVVEVAMLNRASITNILIKQKHWVEVHDAKDKTEATVKAQEYLEALKMLER